MNFQNFEVTPLGNAQLSITPNNTLLVSNIGSSGIDGVSVRIVGHQNCGIDGCSISFKEIPAVPQGGVMRISSIGTNLIHQSVTNSEKIIWYDPATDRVQYGFNMGLMPPQYTLFGELNGNKVFEFQKQNPLCPSSSKDMPKDLLFWTAVAAIAAVVTAAVAVYNALTTTTTTTVEVTCDGDGNVTSTKTTVKEDPVPYEIMVDGQTYTIDHWGISYTEDVPTPEYAYLVNHPTAVQVTGYNLNSIEITSIV